MKEIDAFKKIQNEPLKVSMYYNIVKAQNYQINSHIWLRL